MNLDEIRLRWKLNEKNKQANLNVWNLMADEFANFTLPNFKDDLFLKLLNQENMLNNNSIALDIGCGAGKYSLAISNYCKRIVGIDLSPKMIQIAKQKAIDYNTKNVEFYCENWHSLNVKKPEYLNKFDLVFAHMTPAIQSADTFQKMSLVSKNWCVLAKPIKRKNSVLDVIKDIMNVKQYQNNCDNEILFAFEMLWQQGFLPKLQYEKQVWNIKRSFNEAYNLYVNRIKTYKDITLDDEKMIKNYLKNIECNNFIYEKTDTIIATLFWQVK